MLRFETRGWQNPLTQMTSRRLIIRFAIVTLVMLALYWLIATRSSQEPPRIESREEVNSSPSQPVDTSADSAPALPQGLADADQTAAIKPAPQGSRNFEIFGQTLDSNGEPIEDVFITEERYFDSTRSDAQGNYRLLLELPAHRYPTLNFLRHGFNGKRVKLGRAELQQDLLYRLNVALDGNLDSVRLFGWVGNDIGGALEGARVELTGLSPGNGDNYYLTVFTDVKGNFALEGAYIGDHYKLSVNLAPEYPPYEDDDLVVQANPQLLEIALKSLHFVDVDGMILTRDSTPVADFEIYISNVTTGVHSRKIVSDSSGYFSLKGFPLGEVSFTTRGADFYTISGLVLTDTEYRNLVLTIDRGNHFLSGWTLDANGMVPDRALVTLDKTYREGPIEYQQYLSQATDGDGKFFFENLGDGEYRVTVYAQGYRKRELLYRLQNQSDEIQIVLERSSQ